MASLALHLNLGLEAEDFNNGAVLNAPNPHPTAGYAHGPIPNPNPGWKPPAYHAAMAGGARQYSIKATDISGSPPPNEANVLNKENTGVCDIVVNPPNQMCGMVLPDGPAMRRHIREKHSGALVMPDRRAKRQEDIVVAHNAIKRWILQLGWQRSSYIYEPGRGPENGLIGLWCDALEHIASNDSSFRARFGSRFHRFQVPSGLPTGHRSRRRGPGVPANVISFPGFGTSSNAQGDEDEGDGQNEGESSSVGFETMQ